MFTKPTVAVAITRNASHVLGPMVEEPTPTIRRVLDNADGFRVDCPVPYLLDDLAYLGIVLQHTWHTPAHYHNHFELCYVNEGQGWFAIDDAMYPVRQGDIFLTKPGERHQGSAAGDTPFRLSYLGFRLEHLRSLEVGYHTLGMQRVVPDRYGRIRHACDAIFDELREARPYHAVAIEGLFLHLLVLVLRAYPQDKLDDRKHHPSLSPIVRQILQRLHADVGHHHDVDELARDVHLSRSHLAREFKRHMGVPLGHYMRRLCLDRAKHDLRDTTATVSDIAERLHFTSIHTFSIFFKRYTGLAPQEYRKKILADGE